MASFNDGPTTTYETNEQVVRRYCNESKERLDEASERYEKASVNLTEEERHFNEAKRNYDALMNLLGTYAEDRVPTNRPPTIRPHTYDEERSSHDKPPLYHPINR